ncbi:hypothetical protein BO78DRAFT_448191 [Aspergillus sclerotiicarbonarius CBS 121057]|uniref:Uncharacterized protein n=1 Tax=Aspergillus sclerotiicarbonarius (strain CBS 121057 / IBT 28362) TaxID=1448318 RepID=A0A319E6L0_ASPSB|nr:hypothetical protein BO78DRAFT_448191 [Aspergillus sclerotiicarbonarius CBS 121057]
MGFILREAEERNARSRPVSHPNHVLQGPLIRTYDPDPMDKEPRNRLESMRGSETGQAMFQTLPACRWGRASVDSSGFRRQPDRAASTSPILPKAFKTAGMRREMAGKGDPAGTEGFPPPMPPIVHHPSPHLVTSGPCQREGRTAEI